MLRCEQLLIQRLPQFGPLIAPAETWFIQPVTAPREGTAPLSLEAAGLKSPPRKANWRSGCPVQGPGALPAAGHGGLREAPAFSALNLLNANWALGPAGSSRGGGCSKRGSLQTVREPGWARKPRGACGWPPAPGIERNEAPAGSPTQWGVITDLEMRFSISFCAAQLGVPRGCHGCTTAEATSATGSKGITERWALNSTRFLAQLPAAKSKKVGDGTDCPRPPSADNARHRSCECCRTIEPAGRSRQTSVTRQTAAADRAALTAELRAGWHLKRRE